MKSNKEYKALEEKYARLEKLANNKLPHCKKCGGIDLDIKFGLQMGCGDCGYGFVNTGD